MQRIHHIDARHSEKQIKRLRTLIQDAETNLSAAKELLISLVGDDATVQHVNPEELSGKVIEVSLTARI